MHRRFPTQYVLVVLVLCCGATGVADSPPEREPSPEFAAVKIGVAALIKQIVIAGSELEAKELSRNDSLVVRVVASYPHGTDYRYDIEYFALEAGDYNLLDYMRRKDGSEIGEVHAVTVSAATSLPPGQVKPNALQLRDVAEGGRYRILVIGAVVLWIAGLIAILSIGRRKKVIADHDDEKPKTFADRLRPLLQTAQHGELDVSQKAELERTLLTYWQRRLALEELPPHEAIQVLRSHPEASQLLVQLEQWLHRPGSDADVDVELLLAPYQDMEEPGTDSQDMVTSASEEP